MTGTWVAAGPAVFEARARHGTAGGVPTAVCPSIVHPDHDGRSGRGGRRCRPRGPGCTVGRDSTQRPGPRSASSENQALCGNEVPVVYVSTGASHVACAYGRRRTPALTLCLSSGHGGSGRRPGRVLWTKPGPAAGEGALVSRRRRRSGPAGRSPRIFDVRALGLGAFGADLVPGDDQGRLGGDARRGSAAASGVTLGSVVFIPAASSRSTTSAGLSATGFTDLAAVDVFGSP
jgi:hypothetical protein